MMSSEGGGGGSSLLETSTVLPNTTTFLPILDDLLSPDFRPVTLPPVITPLETPVSAGGGGIPGAIGGSVPVGGGGGGGVGGPGVARQTTVRDRGDGAAHADAATKIQVWWKRERRRGRSTRSGSVEEGVRHSIRHSRAEEHILHLESEITRLKSSLSAERKLRSLQFEAIRSLWSQIQKLSTNNDTGSSMMTQSLPNGLAPVARSSEGVIKSCDCSTEIAELKRKIEVEVGELRTLVAQVVEGRGSNNGGNNNGGASKRPDSLNLNGGQTSVVCSEAVGGYADEVAKRIVTSCSENVGEGST